MERRLIPKIYFDKNSGSGGSSSSSTEETPTPPPEPTVPERMDEAAQNAGVGSVAAVINIGNEQLGK